MSEYLDVKAGDWLVFQDFGAKVGQVAQVTPKLIKFTRDWRLPRQIRRDSTIYGAFADKDEADRLKQSIDGIMGEYARRASAANSDARARIAVAKEAADKQIAALLKHRAE
jgi:hypothetical protein